MAKYPTTPMCDGALLEAFEPSVRDSDIFCATVPKSGQTWLMALMFHLRSRGLDPEMGGKDRMEVMPWLELPFDVRTRTPHERSERLSHFATLPDPRIFKMHVSYDEIPRPAVSHSRIVTITRDPRELPFSMYNHLDGMGRLTPEQEDFNVYFESWLETGYFFEVVRSFWPHREENHLLWLRYEDLQADLPGQARRLCDFLGWPLHDADLERVLPLVSFSHMQGEEDRRRMEQPEQSIWREGKRFFREGAVGNNSERLSESQRRRVVERARELLHPECFDFVMSLD
ncbi:MAG: sulfotransferase domain-containing protein [Myxococcales bacterium]|nr:sulfotransferase domain-containing protein [Myxococcales bacterium]